VSVLHEREKGGDVAPDHTEESFRYFAVFVAVLIAMIGTFGAWRRGLESLGVGDSASFAVAIVADVVLMTIVLFNEIAWSDLTTPRRDFSWSILLGAAISGFGVRLGLLYLYGWISRRGGGDWWDLYFL